jgi:hypothetical protein
VTGLCHHPSMKTASSDRTGMLIVRLWIEGSPQTGLRARITRTLDTSGPEHAVAIAATADDVYAIVRTWVEEFSIAN